MDKRYNYNSLENEAFINEVLGKNHRLKENFTKTNGKLSINEVLKKYPSIKDDFRMGEKVKYITYKLNTKIKLALMIFSIATFFLGFNLFVNGFGLNEASMVFIITFSFTIFGYFNSKEIFIITNKSFILIKPRLNNKSIRINYKNIKSVKISRVKNNTFCTIKDVELKKIQTSIHKNTLKAEILTLISEQIKVSEEVFLAEKKSAMKILKIKGIFIVLSSCFLIYIFYQTPYMREGKIFGYSAAFIATLLVLSSSIFQLKILFSTIKKKYTK